MNNQDYKNLIEQIEKVRPIQEEMAGAIKKAQSMQKFVVDEMRRMQPFQEQMQKAARQAFLMQRQMIEATQHIQPMIKQASEQLQSFLGSETFKQIRERAEQFCSQQQQLFESFKEIAEDWSEIKRICFELGWFPHGEWGQEAGRTILKLYKEKNLDQLNNEICDFYNERILEITNKWGDLDNLDKRRLQIIKQAVMAHLNGYYETSIIVLLSQIEGQIRDELVIRKKINHSNLLKEYKARLKKDEKEALKEVYVDMIFSLMLNKLYKDHGHAKKRGVISLTRHSVLHGFFLGPYDRSRSTQLILLLNFIITTDMWI